MIASTPMANFLQPADLFPELETLTTQVRRLQSELAALRPDGLSGLHIARAGDHLAAVAAAVERSANRILDAAEQIEMFSADLDAIAAQAVESSVTRLYEACSFHEATGRQLAKVADGLGALERRLGCLARAFGPARDDPGQLVRAALMQIAANDDRLGCPIDQEAVDGLLATII